MLTAGLAAEHLPHSNGAANGYADATARLPKSSSREDPVPAPSSRFSETDLDTISSLVGLETITSTQEHCGSHSLYLFEQLTALDRQGLCTRDLARASLVPLKLVTNRTCSLVPSFREFLRLKYSVAGESRVVCVVRRICKPTAC